jgi:hypothetical protein
MGHGSLRRVLQRVEGVRDFDAVMTCEGGSACRPRTYGFSWPTVLAVDVRVHHRLRQSGRGIVIDPVLFVAVLEGWIHVLGRKDVLVSSVCCALPFLVSSVYWVLPCVMTCLSMPLRMGMITVMMYRFREHTIRRVD